MTKLQTNAAKLKDEAEGSSFEDWPDAKKLIKI